MPDDIAMGCEASLEENMRMIALIVTIALTGAAAAKELDLSTMDDPTGVYNIAFCARPSPDASGKPGHAFVAYSHAAPGKDRDFVAIGLTVGADVTPAAAIWSYFGSPVSGLLKEERYTAIKQNCLDVKVNKDDFNHAKALAADPLATMGLTPQEGTVFEAYKLGGEDCLAFMMKVATILKPRGLNVPSRGAAELPMNYMLRFISANSN
jgi:hypothetical protein